MNRFILYKKNAARKNSRRHFYKYYLEFTGYWFFQSLPHCRIWFSGNRNLHQDSGYWWWVSYHPVSYTHLRAHETVLDLVCRLLLEKKQNKQNTNDNIKLFITTTNINQQSHIIKELIHQSTHITTRKPASISSTM